MLWASVAVHVAPLYCHSLSILLVSPMKKRVSLFEQKDTEAAMPFSPVGDRNLWLRREGKEFYEDHYCYPTPILFLFQPYSPLPSL